VWRSSSDDYVYYQTSADNGKTWNNPTPIPGIFARPWNSPPNDQYALARDDSGILHLVMVARRSSNASNWVVAHLKWNGSEWSNPEIIFDRDGLYPEYPRIAVALGHQIHAVWFTRTDVWSGGTIDVWHSYKTEGSLFTPVPSFPTPTVVNLTPTPLISPIPTRTPLPKPQFNTNDLPPTSNLGSMLPLVAGVGAAFVSIAIALIIRRKASEP
jgi:hypothetical protein